MGEFEGPLGVLLELVERNQLPVTHISVATITAQYLAQVEKLRGEQSPETLSEFIQLGARLLYIKSLALLPRESATEQEDELRQLNLELEEYKRFQQVARQLGRQAEQGSWQRPVMEQLESHELPLPPVSLAQLTAAFQRALRQSEPAKPARMLTAHLSQETVMKTLRDRLQQESIELQHVLDNARSRLEIIVTFLAVLELARSGELRVTQMGQFAPVLLEAVHG